MRLPGQYSTHRATKGLIYISSIWKALPLIIHVLFAHGVMVIVVENGHGDPSSNTGSDWLHFT